MKIVVLALSFVFTAAICFAQEGGNTAQTMGSSVLNKAKVWADKEISAMVKVAKVNKVKGFNKQMTDDLAAKLVTNEAAQKQELQDIAAKLSKEDKAKLEEYAKKKVSEINNKDTVIIIANNPGQVKSWCQGSYHGTLNTDKLCTGVIEWCWDVCNLPDQSKRYYTGPYVCGGCFIKNY